MQIINATENKSNLYTLLNSDIVLTVLKNLLYKKSKIKH